MNQLKKIVPYPLKRLYRRIRTQMRGDTVAVCHVRGLTIRVGVSSEIEEFRVNTYATKEPDTLDWLDKNLQAGDLFVDIGANIGVYSFYAAQRNAQCRVFSFEPSAINFSRLCNNIGLNHLQNILPCNVPLSDVQEFTSFFVSDLQAGQALNTLGDDAHTPNKFALKQKTLSTTLDLLVAQYAMPQPNLIKLDVDGFEPRILMGASQVLRSSSLRSILVEWNYKDESSVTMFVDQMSQLGLRLVNRSVWIWEQDGVKAQNFIFNRS